MKKQNDYPPRYFPFYGKLRYLPADRYLLSEYEYDGTEACTDGSYWDIVHISINDFSSDYFYTNFLEVYLNGEGMPDD